MLLRKVLSSNNILLLEITIIVPEMFINPIKKIKNKMIISSK